MSDPVTLTTRDQVRAWRTTCAGSVALVPTMGALHDGHVALMTAARRDADTVVVSNFVNPLQFGPDEDLARYPRTPEADRARCVEAGVDAIFAPSVDEMYATDRQVSVSSGRMGTVLEGASRPGHFDGVLTVVTKLFILLRPDRAYFGLKDIQQFALVNRLVTDLDLGVEIVGVPIVRDADGLALSSRNTYLDASERRAALALSRALAAVDDGGPATTLLARARAVLDEAAGEPRFSVDYAELVDFATFSPVDDGFRGRAVLALAARVGSTRLIDNRVLDL